jgi:hypothetical protein
MNAKLIFAAALSVAAILPAAAQAHYYYNGYYSPYVGPHGHYRSYAAFNRSIQGTPCGQECTRHARRYWYRHEVR